MARVTQAHLDARRQQILDGARSCFTRNGFHATSMQDVFKEVGLSAGAVYRYFPSKDELIKAVAMESFGGMREAFASAAHRKPLRPVDEVIGGVLGRALEGGGHLAGGGDPRAYPQLILQVWSESLRNESLNEALQEGYRGMLEMWTALVKEYQAEGVLRTDLPAVHIARTLMAVCQGFIAQQAVFGGVSSEMLRDGLRGLRAP